MACLADSLMNSGMVKSGSPRLNPMMSLPSFFNSLAFAAIARVAEISIFWTRSDGCEFIIFFTMQFSDCNVSDNFVFLMTTMKAQDLLQYFPQLTDIQKERFELLGELYQDWNQKINVVSRKDIEELYLRHVLHSLAIGLFQEFKPGSRIIDVGTGGGFPGIPLAILFPEVSFTLVDSIGKKIKVVDEVVAGLKLTNVISINDRVENVAGTFDFIVSRAVAAMPTFVHWVEGKISLENKHERANGILYLKGGDLTEELAPFKNKITVYDLYDRIPLDFFETKRLVYLPLS